MPSFALRSCRVRRWNGLVSFGVIAHRLRPSTGAREFTSAGSPAGWNSWEDLGKVASVFLVFSFFLFVSFLWSFSGWVVVEGAEGAGVSCGCLRFPGGCCEDGDREYGSWVLWVWGGNFDRARGRLLHVHLLPTDRCQGLCFPFFVSPVPLPLRFAILVTCFAGIAASASWFCLFTRVLFFLLLTLKNYVKKIWPFYGRRESTDGIGLFCVQMFNWIILGCSHS